ncbi:NAD(P)-binding protein, partial [Staphylococcus aureus]|nr:NAD(P)-binding protein [Staphylococcus aureus]
KVLDMNHSEKQQLLSQIVTKEFLNDTKQAQFLAWLDKK